MENETTRYEEYRFSEEGIPFVLFSSLERTPLTLSRQANWHESAEIEWVLEGEGSVRIDGHVFPFAAGDVAVIAPGEIHYTSTEHFLRYGCLIVDPAFCRRFGIDPAAHRPGGAARDPRLFSLLTELCGIAERRDDACHVAKTCRALLSVLILLCETYGSPEQERRQSDPAAERVKAVLRYLRKRYAEPVSLDGIAETLFIGKFQLSREFKRYTGMTVVTCLEHLRCTEAAALIRSGCPVGEAAERSGFRNLSFFTRVFKREFGCLPSQLKKCDNKTAGQIP